MNRILASALSGLNAVIAVVIVLVALVSGYSAMGGTGLVVDLVLGGLIAIVTCGFIAYLALIEQHLRKISGDGAAALPKG